MQTALAGCSFKLFQASLVPTPSTPVADYDAAEANYDTYAAVTVAAWNDPALAEGSGFAIQSPLAVWNTGATDPVVPNMIGGLYVVDAGGALRGTLIFDTPIPMQLAYQNIPVSITLLFPTGF